MNLPCNELGPKIMAFLDDELEADEYQRIKSHIDTCPVCQKQMQELQKTGKLITEALSETPDVNFEKIWTNIQPHIRPRLSIRQLILKWFSRPVIWAPAVATCAAILFLAVWLPAIYEPKTCLTNRVESVSSPSGPVMILETVNGRQPIIWYSEGQTKEPHS